MKKVVYSYDKNTKEFLGKCEAEESPLEKGIFIYPADTTEIPPPDSIPHGNVAIFNGSTWDVVRNMRLTDIVEFIDGQFSIHRPYSPILSDNQFELTPEIQDAINKGQALELVDGKLVIIPLPKQEEAKQRISELESYLYQTDWYITRKSETGVDIPVEVSAKRANARLEISDLRLSIDCI